MENTNALNTLTAKALKNLRLRSGLTLEALGEIIRKAKQTISQWEAGRVILTDDHINPYLSALRETRDSLNVEINRLSNEQGTSLSFERRPWHKEFPEDLRAEVLQNDDIAPWAERGERVFYDPTRPPTGGQGCIVELKSGEVLPRFYEKSSDGRAFLRKNNPEQVESYLWSDIDRISRIVLRSRD